MPQAKIYMQITFIGRLPSMICNFISGVVNAKGDSKTPMFIALVSGALKRESHKFSKNYCNFRNSML